MDKSEKMILAAAAVALALVVWWGVWWVTSRPTYLTYFPPKDLYDLLVEQEIDFSKEGRTFEFTLQHKYRGIHCIEISVSNSLRGEWIVGKI